MTSAVELYRRMLLIRRFEERVLELFSQGKLSGTTHTYIGQEAGAAGVLSHLGEEDTVFSNHRCHGHYLVKTNDPAGLLSEMMGKASGACGGLGGSQHLCRRKFYSNGILGSYLPIAAGVALAEKLRASRHIVVVCMGDGTLGEGVVYETFNMASLYGLPLLLLIENNHIAQTTPIALHLAGSIAARPRAFGIQATEIDAVDVGLVHARAGAIIAEIRATSRPHALILDTNRFAPHSKGDDTRSPQELAEIRARDPLTMAGAALDEGERSATHAAVNALLAEAEALAAAAPVSDREWRR